MNEESTKCREYELEREYWDEKFEAERVTNKCVIMSKK